MKELLAEIEQALDDWITTHAPEFCERPNVEDADKRLMDKGGVLAYVTDLRERVAKARKEIKP